MTSPSLLFKPLSSLSAAPSALVSAYNLEFSNDFFQWYSSGEDSLYEPHFVQSIGSTLEEVSSLKHEVELVVENFNLLPVSSYDRLKVTHFGDREVVLKL